MPAEPSTAPDAGADQPTTDPAHDDNGAQDPPVPLVDHLDCAELKAKLQELDNALRNDIISTFREFEKVLRRTRQDLARERFARKDLEEMTAMRINQLQAMVDELAPRFGPQRHGPVQARRNERNERQRQLWEGMLWHD